MICAAPSVCTHGPRAVFLCQYRGNFWLRRAKDTWRTSEQIVALLKRCPLGFGHTVEGSHFPFACSGRALQEGRCAC